MTLSRKNRTIILTIFRYAVLILVGLIMFYPLLWLFGASFKTNNEIFSSIGIIPKQFDFSGYINGWQTSTEYTFLRYFINTYSIVLPKVLVTIVSCTITAYGFARFDFIGKKMLFAILMSTLFLPQVVLNIPQYLLFRDLKWLDSYLPLIIPSAFALDTYFVFMLVQFLRGIPKELEESAKIDGCNSLKTLWLIIVPMLRPALVSCALFQFMWSSNDFMGPLIYISSVSKYPASIALKMSMDASSVVAWNNIIAISVIAILPSLVVFFLAQNEFVEGISAGAVKG